MTATGAGHRRWGHSASTLYSCGIAPRHRTFGSCTANILRIIVKRPCALTPTCGFSGSAFKGRQLASSSISVAIAASTGYRRGGGQPAPVRPRLGIAPRLRTFRSCTARILRIFCSSRVCSHQFAAHRLRFGHDRQLASTPSSDAIAAGTGLRRWGQPALGAASEGDIPSVAIRWKLAQPGFHISFRVSHACSHRFAAGHDRQLAITSISDVIAASTGHRRWGKLAPGTASRGFPPSIETMGACTACFLRIIIEAAVGALILRPWALSLACDS